MFYITEIKATKENTSILDNWYIGYRITQASNIVFATVSDYNRVKTLIIG